MRELDAIGLACPLPVLKARKLLATMQPGEQLLVRASDPMAAIDVPHLCQQDDHILVSRSTARIGDLDVLSFVVERGADPAR